MCDAGLKNLATQFYCANLSFLTRERVMDGREMFKTRVTVRDSIFFSLSRIPKRLLVLTYVRESVMT
jgi:hypothetical protein